MNDSRSSPTKPLAVRPRWQWWALLIIPVIVLVVAWVAAVGFVLFHLQHADERQIQQADAELDAAEPGWRLRELEAARSEIPDERNAASCLRRAQDLIIQQSPEPPGGPLLWRLEPQYQLSPAQTAMLEARVELERRALHEAEELADLPEGRYVVNWYPNPTLTESSLTTEVGASGVIVLLQRDLLLQAQSGDCRTALKRARALLNAGRAVGNTFFASPQFLRLADIDCACFGVERTLAQGQPPAADLEAIQRCLEEEDRFEDTLVWIAARGERGCFHEYSKEIAAGRISFVQAPPLQAGDNYARSLRCLTGIAEVAKLPPPERTKKMAELEASVKGKHLLLLEVFLPPVMQMDRSVCQTQALLRSTIVALAAERYRLANGRWPASPVMLLPAQLPRVPTDPFDGQPLRYRRVPDGLVIYSIGLDGKDDGGTLDRNNPLRQGIDLGVRLWDVTHRRQRAQDRADKDDGN